MRPPGLDPLGDLAADGPVADQGPPRLANLAIRRGLPDLLTLQVALLVDGQDQADGVTHDIFGNGHALSIALSQADTLGHDLLEDRGVETCIKGLHPLDLGRPQDHFEHSAQQTRAIGI